MKKKGFTLVELLSVIVILAVIAIIAVPIISNVLEKTRKSAFKDSALNAFGQVEYYMIQNSLTQIPKEGLSITKIGLKEGNLESGYFVKNSKGNLEAVQITDGSYCANGEMTGLVVTKGKCEAIVPVITINVNQKVAEVILEDSIGLVGYAITRSDEEPTEWIELGTTKIETITYEAQEAGTYYVYVKNIHGKISSSNFEIDASLFNYEATLTTSTYTAQTNTSTYNATGSNYSYTCNKAFTARTGPFQDGSYNHWCASGHQTNTGSASISGTCQHKISGTNYSCPKGGTLSGTTCTVTSYSCPDGGTLSGTTCTKEEYTCPNGGTLNGTTCEL